MGQKKVMEYKKAVEEGKMDAYYSIGFNSVFFIASLATTEAFSTLSVAGRHYLENRFMQESDN